MTKPKTKTNPKTKPRRQRPYWPEAELASMREFLEKTNRDRQPKPDDSFRFFEALGVLVHVWSSTKYEPDLDSDAVCDLALVHMIEALADGEGWFKAQEALATICDFDQISRPTFGMSISKRTKRAA